MWNNAYFAPDIPDLQISYSQGDTIAITVASLSGTTLADIQEAYAPDEDGYVTVRDMADIAMAYIEPLDVAAMPPLLSTFNPAVNITVTVTHTDNTTSTYTTKARFATSRTTDTPLDPDTYDGFLTRYTKRTITPRIPIILSHRTGLGVTLSVTYLNAGVLKSADIVLSATSTTGVNVRCLTLAYLATQTATATGHAVNTDDIVTVKAMLTNGGTVCDTIIYNIDQAHQRQQTAFLFTNLFGCPEAEVLTGSDHTEADIDAQFAYRNRQYRRSWQQIDDKHTVNSGYVTREQYQSLRDLAQSPLVMIIKSDGTLEEATVTDIELNDTHPRSTPTTATVKYRIANRTQQRFLRQRQTATRIFDNTFDQSFE